MRFGLCLGDRKRSDLISSARAAEMLGISRGHLRNVLSGSGDRGHAKWTHHLKIIERGRRNQILLLRSDVERAQAMRLKKYKGRRKIYIIVAWSPDGLPLAAKIGIASNVNKRCYSLQTAHYSDVLRPYVSYTPAKGKSARSVEKRLHIEMCGARIRGEWYEPLQVLALVGDIRQSPELYPWLTES